MNGNGAVAGQIQVPPLVVELANAGARVVRGEAGERTLVIGPLLLHVSIPLGRDAARLIARELAGGVEIASGLPAPPPAPSPPRPATPTRR